jgi:isoleucyl-tRNA synthetase
VLFDVLLKLSILLSPYVPFTTDSFYQNLRQCIRSERYAADSIHFLQIPEFNPALIDEAIELDVTRMQGVINNARKIRETKNISLKQPIISLTIITNNDSLIASVLRLRTYIEEEVNTPQIIIEKDASQFVELKAEPNNQICGKELGERFCKDFITKVRALNQDQIRQF